MPSSMFLMRRAASPMTGIPGRSKCGAVVCGPVSIGGVGVTTTIAVGVGTGVGDGVGVAVGAGVGGTVGAGTGVSVGAGVGVGVGYRSRCGRWRNGRHRSGSWTNSGASIILAHFAGCFGRGFRHRNGWKRRSWHRGHRWTGSRGWQNGRHWGRGRTGSRGWHDGRHSGRRLDRLVGRIVTGVAAGIVIRLRSLRQGRWGRGN